ncbi:MAG TPA: hypothetical protein VIN06_03975 [Devosia sp.]
MKARVGQLSSAKAHVGQMQPFAEVGFRDAGTGDVTGRTQMGIVVQIVEILWTKATRGSPRANERASLPRQFSLSGETDTYVVQHHRLVEWKDNFAPQPIKVEVKRAVPGVEGELRIVKRHDGSIQLGLTGTPYGGQPPRVPVTDGPILGPGGYVRLRVNARHTSYSGQWYSEKVFNVAMGDHVPADRFLLTQPDKVLDLMADLF